MNGFIARAFEAEPGRGAPGQREAGVAGWGAGLAGWYGARAVRRLPSSRDSSTMRKTFTCKKPSLKSLRVNTR